jgi:hypothetical protein
MMVYSWDLRGTVGISLLIIPSSTLPIIRHQYSSHSHPHSLPCFFHLSQSFSQPRHSQAPSITMAFPNVPVPLALIPQPTSSPIPLTQAPQTASRLLPATQKPSRTSTPATTQTATAATPLCPPTTSPPAQSNVQPTPTAAPSASSTNAPLHPPLSIPPAAAPQL